MENFSICFTKIKGLFEYQRDPNLNRVKVVLINNGVDITHEDLLGKGLLGESFDNSNNGVHPFWHSASGYGTLMARLIQKICPSAIIYIIKLKTFRMKTLGRLQIDMGSAIQVSSFLPNSKSIIIIITMS